MFTLTVTDDQLHLISEGLGFLPYSRVQPLFQELQGQVNVQLNAAQAAEQAAAETRRIAEAAGAANDGAAAEFVPLAASDTASGEADATGL